MAEVKKEKPLRTDIDRSLFRSFANLVCEAGHYSYAPHNALMTTGSECLAPLSSQSTSTKGRCRAKLSVIERRKR